SHPAADYAQGSPHQGMPLDTMPHLLRLEATQLPVMGTTRAPGRKTSARAAHCGAPVSAGAGGGSSRGSSRAALGGSSLLRPEQEAARWGEARSWPASLPALPTRALGAPDHAQGTSFPWGHNACGMILDFLAPACQALR